ncbi:hypothetical protein KCU77_g296, partial [Aureobasidium melanogenum]
MSASPHIIEDSLQGFSDLGLSRSDASRGMSELDRPIHSDATRTSDNDDHSSSPTLPDVQKSALHELQSSESLGTAAVFHILETLLLPDICIVEVGGSHNLRDWEEWAQVHRPPPRLSEGDIVLVPLLRSGHWSLLHLDCKKHKASFHNPETGTPDPQSMDIFRAIARIYAKQDPPDWQVEVNIEIPQGFDVSDGGIYVLVVALRILAGTPLLEPYDCRLWRMLLASVVQGYPSAIEEARGIFVEFPVYNCDPGKLMVNQLSEMLRGFGTARNKLEKGLGFAKDQVALVSSLYANIGLA